MKPRVSATAALLSVICCFLAGCSQSTAFPTVGDLPPVPSPASAARLQGTIHGGQQPITNARVYLLAAGKTGYGSPASSLLTSAAYPGYPAVQDAAGRYYVTSDSNGFFQIADSCTPGQQVYMASVGGNPGFGSNSAATEIAILGTCPSAGNFDSTYTGVFISEISTVAAAFSAAAYATDVFDIGAPGGTLAQTGITNAFANAANLFDVQNINDLARSTNVSGSGTVPQAKINTLANILAACINSIGPSSPSCSTLFLYAQTGGTTGTPPTDVATAAINMAHNPSSLGVPTLYSLQGGNHPFGPVLGSAPGDFTIAVNYANAALGSNPSLAVDAGGNIWTITPGISAITKISPTGAIPVPQYAIGGTFNNSRSLAVDPSNNIWVLGQTAASGLFGTLYTVPAFAKLTNLGVYQSTINETPAISSHPPSNTTNLVIDGNGAFYYSAAYDIIGLISTTCCTVKFDPVAVTYTNLDTGNASPGNNFVAVSTSTQWATGGGSVLSLSSASSSRTVSGGGLNTATGVALDNAGRAWVVNQGNNSVSLFTSTGTPVSASGYTGNLAVPKSVAVDGAGNVWATNSSGGINLAEFSSTGAAIGNGYASPGLAGAGSLAIDPSGNIWVASPSSPTITQFLGLAAPVVTPASTAIGTGKLGTMPQ